MTAAAGMRLRSVRRERPPSQDADSVPSGGTSEPVPTFGDVPAWGRKNGDREREEGAFECNICLDLACEPVVTQCGHLYCWACIYKWLNLFRERQQCPLCKAGVCEELLIPLYGRGVRGRDQKGSKNMPGKDRVPDRPQGLRISSDDPRLANIREDLGFMSDSDIVGERLNGWSSFLFLGSGRTGTGLRDNVGRGSMSPEQQQHVFLSRMLLLLGSFVILCLLIF